MQDEPYFGLRLTTSAIGNSKFHRSQVCVAAQATRPLCGLFLLQAPIDKLSILPVCGFNGTSFVGVADIFPKLATMVGRKCSRFR
jgi:hypothetical protein